MSGEARIGRRALMASGLGLAALAAAPAAACSLTGTRTRPAEYYSDRRARAALQKLVAEASRGEAASWDVLSETGIDLYVGDAAQPTLPAKDWLLSEGRRDAEPARIVGMEALGAGRRERLYLVAIRRSAWQPASEGDSCSSDTPEGHYRRIEAWLYNFAPDGSSSLRRAPELVTHLRAYVPEAREELGFA